MEYVDIIAENIRILRITKGLSQEQLALSAGITPSYIGQIERKEKVPTISIVGKICNALDVSMVDLMSIHEVKGDSSKITSTNEIRQVMLEVLRETRLINPANQSLHSQSKPKQ